MIKEFSYSFNELSVNQSEIAVLLGYPVGILPEPFSDYLEEAIIEADHLCDIKGAIYRTHDVRFSEKKHQIIVEGKEFGIGKTIAKELRHSDSIVFFLCTAGKGISELSRDLLSGDNPVLGYVYDVLGSVIVEAASHKIHQEIRNLADISGQLITNRYSPGYCQWSVDDQHRLFSFFPENCCGISLTDSALMHPVKSVSGIVGMGKEVKFREYTCDLCSLTNCFYRNSQKEK
ncbi:MAG: vitamin B12 dependent-methionine synthase activation domain-containing protein [Bacteroidota bacterium]|nr:vitamin B12 dependent-methionine synthase activation domain-containing protein [Bacteroidota bacterium]